ncbi:MAG: PDZ domain-containing protein [Duodenibacillus sp.]|nr:PDZ domain-containing protein [Duodenibacillus sp.]
MVGRRLAESFGMDKPAGALVSRIDKNGPAAKSDLREGDVVIAVDDKEIASSTDMPVAIGSIAPGKTAKLTVLRDGKRQTVKVEVAAAEGDAGGAAAEPEKPAPAALGLTVRPLTDLERQKLGIAEGLFVSEAEGAGMKAGIRTGDVLINVNGVPMREASDLRRAVAKGSKVARVLLQRRDSRIFVAVRQGE